jgi:hypothetical protein
MKKNTQETIVEEKTAWNDKLGIWLAGAAIGAVAMYLSDPDRGTRRRALVRDQLNHLKTKSANAIGVAARDLVNRMKGMQASLNRLTHSRSTESLPDPDITIARMRARMGHYVSHPHSIKITWQDGRYVLSGPVLAYEKAKLLMALRKLPGAVDIEDCLEVHEHAEGIPGLQGTRAHWLSGAGSLETNWPPGLRGVAVATGGLLTIYGLARHQPGSLLLGVAGIALLVRGATNSSLAELLEGRGESPRPRQAAQREQLAETSSRPAAVVHPLEQASPTMH